ncbi:MAG: FG-GAP-like repeat-containing protein, partial [Planctomycetota bacterium]
VSSPEAAAGPSSNQAHGAHAFHAAAGAGAVDLTPDEVEGLVEELGPWFERFVDVARGAAEPASLGTAFRAVAHPDVRRAREIDPEKDAYLDVPWWTLAPSTDWVKIPSVLRGDGDVHVHLKVVGARGVADAAELDLRIEAERRSHVSEAATGQATLHARLTLERMGDRWIPLTATLDAIEGTQRTGQPLFVERTRGLFAHDAAAAEVLAVGMDRLAARLDDPGLTAWFGHQGLAAGDLTGDGRPDLYVGMPAGVPNMLLVQQPDGTVVDRARDFGLAWLDDTKGVVLDDVTGDGVVDALSALGHVIVVQPGVARGANDAAAPLAVFGWCVAPDEAPFYSIATTDLDGDGLHEIFGTRYVTTRYVDSMPVPFDEARNGPENCLFRFDGQRYREFTRSAGLVDGEGGRFSLAASFVDATGDGRDDLYVVNDFGSNQLFVRADGEGVRFVERGVQLGLADPGAGMGASWGDVDLDGDLDVYVTNMFSSAGQRVAFRDAFGEGLDASRIAGARMLTEGSALYVQDGDRFRPAESVVPGLVPSMGRWGWGGILVDADCDGYDDVVAPAGFLTGPKPGDL